MPTVETILTLYSERVSHYGPMHTRMREVEAVYNGNKPVELPDMDRDAPNSAPNLLTQGIDQMASRIASVTPMVTFSPENNQRAAERRADTAQRAVTGWWQMDRLPMKLKQRARHLIAYGLAPTVIRWNPRTRTPTWHVRSPLETFPSPDIIPGVVTPNDVIFAYRRSEGWLRTHGYSAQVSAVTGRYDTIDRDRQLLLLEYVDADGTVLVVTDIPDPSASGLDGYHTLYGGSGAVKGAVLETIPSPTGVMPVTVPTRIALNGPAGQFDGMLGMYYQQSKLMALEVLAVEKGIFPDTYLVSRPGEVGRFIDGPHDGRTGLVNIIAGGDVRALQDQPGYLTNPTIDRLERNQRVTAGIPSEFGGESPTNVRTGRRGDSIMSAVIDFPVAEAQEVIAAALTEENKAGIALAKKMAGDDTVTVFVGTGNQTKPTRYKANDVFKHDDHVVSYPVSGTDLNALMIGLGQRVGLGTMSKETAATLDPFIDNPESEHDRIIAEGLEQALVAGIQQQAASGQIPPATLSKVMQLVKTDRLELADAITKAMNDAAEAQQAEQGQAGLDAGPTAAALSGNPEAMAAIGPPQQSQQNLSNLLGTLRRPVMGVSPDVGVRGRV